MLVVGQSFDSALALGSMTIACGILSFFFMLPGLPPATEHAWNPYDKRQKPIAPVVLNIVPQTSSTPTPTSYTPATAPPTPAPAAPTLTPHANVQTLPPAPKAVKK